MDQLGFIHRYVGSGKKQHLSTLGSKKWQNEVKKAKESAKEVVYEIFNGCTFEKDKATDCMRNHHLTMIYKHLERHHYPFTIMNTR